MTHCGAKAFGLLIAAAALLTPACATTRASNTGGGRQDVLTRAQIMSVAGAQNLYDVVQRLRPRWLTVRAENRSMSGAAAELVVYQDQAFLGNPETLRQLGVSVAHELRFLDGTTASSTLPGLGAGRHVAGAIIIMTRDP